MGKLTHRGFLKTPNPSTDGTLNLALALAIADTGKKPVATLDNVRFWFDIAANVSPELIAEAKEVASLAKTAGLLGTVDETLNDLIPSLGMPPEVAKHLFCERVSAELEKIGATSALTVQGSLPKGGEIVANVRVTGMGAPLAGRVWLDFYRMGLENGSIGYAICGWCKMPYRRLHGRALFCCVSHRTTANKQSRDADN
ncbi:hypothetical protein [Flavobacterium sp.]|jgi:hypothetical protein|uniref:hypothetical protein n=1 Tax=Flavobacterium sp. TaxID=239 RepID=UPI0037C05E71